MANAISFEDETLDTIIDAVTDAFMALEEAETDEDIEMAEAVLEYAEERRDAYLDAMGISLEDALEMTSVEAEAA